MLADSVAAHMVADVPVGAFLSGGLDSSLLSVLAAEHNRNIHAYTVSFRPQDQRFEAMPDDLATRAGVAADHGMTLHEVAGGARREPTCSRTWCASSTSPSGTPPRSTPT